MAHSGNSKKHFDELNRWSIIIARAGIVFLASWPTYAVAVVGGIEPSDFGDRVVMVTRENGYCSGVVIAPQIVLTAAHCLEGPTDEMHVVYYNGNFKPVPVPIEATAIHPNYQPDAARLRLVSIDLGLVKTAAPLPSPFRPALLSRDGVTVGEWVTVAGFGVKREGDTGTGAVLREALLQVRAPLSSVLIWATDPVGAGACSGDAGGPILGPDRQSVVAITVWSAGVYGNHCGALTQGPLVAPNKPWIDSVVAGWALSSVDSTGQPPLAVNAPSLPTYVQMVVEGGTFAVPVVINNELTLKFVLDSGAADVSIPTDVFKTLMRTGTIVDSDLIGMQDYILADGSAAHSQTFQIRSLKVGNRVVQNVTARVAPIEGSLLLGQSFLSRFKNWSIDNSRNVLVLQ